MEKGVFRGGDGGGGYSCIPYEWEMGLFVLFAVVEPASIVFGRGGGGVHKKVVLLEKGIEVFICMWDGSTNILKGFHKKNTCSWCTAWELGGGGRLFLSYWTLGLCVVQNNTTEGFSQKRRVAGNTA